MPGRSARGSDFPAFRAQFFGRDTELARIAAELERPGVVSVVGLGGMGKTRLAVEAARRFDGPVVFVDLVGQADPAGLCEAVAAALGSVRAVPMDEVSRLGHALEHRGAGVLVLDNFEQLVGSSVEVVKRWAELAPAARILVTSRVPLALTGERVVQLGPLQTDAARALLADRARAARGETVELDGVDAVVEVLDGVPLALELVAARADVLSWAQMVPRAERMALDARESARDARSRSLRDALSWSWAALTEDDRQTLTEASLFAAPFDVDAAEAVLSTGDAVEGLLRLRRRSWLVVETSASERRFRMLVPVAAFLAERATERDLAGARERHARWVTERVWTLKAQPRPGGWLAGAPPVSMPCSPTPRAHSRRWSASIRRPRCGWWWDCPATATAC